MLKVRVKFRSKFCAFFIAFWLFRVLYKMCRKENVTEASVTRETVRDVPFTNSSTFKCEAARQSKFKKDFRGYRLSNIDFDISNIRRVHLTSPTVY